VAIKLVYTNCKDECPRETARLVQVQRLLGQFLATTIGTFLGKWQDPKPKKGYTEAHPLMLDQEGDIFRTRCTTCHTIWKGAGVGPDLARVTTRRERAWLARYLAAPDQMLVGGDPIAPTLFATYKGVRMPNLRLSDADVAVLLSYLETPCP
jgi:protein SCO1